MKIKNKGNFILKEPIGIPSPEKPTEIEPLNDPIAPKIYPDELPNIDPEQEPTQKPPFELPKPTEFENTAVENNNRHLSN
jgi:hypothetical protein